MRTHILAEREVECPPADAVARIYRTLGVDRRGVTTCQLSVPLEKLGLPALGKLSRTALVFVGQARRRKTDNATIIPLRWRDLESDTFPAFHGEIEITPLATWQVQLAIIGDYVPPLGPIGAAFDLTLGKSIAEATVNDLLDRLAGIASTARPVLP